MSELCTLKSKTQEILLQKQMLSNDITPFADFMQQALYAPGTGYYTGTTSKIGAKGDFITAPEVSPVFSQCVATQCQQVIQAVDNGVIVEIGAGLGTMAADMLQYLQTVNALPKHYYILEISPWLREQQRQRIQQKAPDLFGLVTWMDQPLTEPFNGVIVGNEIIDALPVHRFQMKDGQICELGVGVQNSQFVSSILPKPNPKLITQVQQIQANIGQLPEGYCSEVLLHIDQWLGGQTKMLQQGIVLLIDYGYSQKEYYAPYRATGTLRCHYQHQAHDNPFIHIGEQDITAHVDFTALAEAAIEVGLTVSGYTTQAMFLAACGFQDKANDQAYALRRLTHPTLMGELFKAIAFSKQYDQLLIGFQLNNMKCFL